MPQSRMVSWAALAWGLAVYLPVGPNYAGFVLLALALVFDRASHAVRWRQLKTSAGWWAACALLAWTVLILLLGPHYAQTSSNALHVLRLCLTLLLVLLLSPAEAACALAGFVMATVLSLVLVLLDQVFDLPPSVLWNRIVQYGGNKSLSNAVLLGLAAWVSLLLLLDLPRIGRVLALVLAAAALLAIMWVLPARTAWIVVLLGLLLAFLHRWQGQGRRQAVASLAALVLGLALALGVAPVRDRLLTGWDEISQTVQGESVDLNKSWGIRARMYEVTLDMIRDKPLTGWGVGAWNTLWDASVAPREPKLVGLNMPHNDFLWMGAQTGLPGAVALLWVLLAGAPRAWRQRDASGRLGVVATGAIVVACMSNSALRDASIGMSLWFVVAICQRLGREPLGAWLPWASARRS